MAQLNLTASESVTFPEAIALTQQLLEQIEAGISEAEIQQAVTSLVRSTSGARGFFVTYLTSDRPLADHPSQAVIQALQTSPEIVGELLVKNVAMSAAMAVTHRRNNDQEDTGGELGSPPRAVRMAQSSQKTCRRSANLIKQVQIDSIADKLEQLRASAATDSGNYQAFLQRWDYDTEQRQAILEAINKCLTP